MLTTKEIEALPKVNKYMMATMAVHQLGDLSSDVPDLCYIKYASSTDYYGSWVEGFGFVNVKFPKETTRDLTQEEITKYNKLSIRINNQPAMRLKVDSII